MMLNVMNVRSILHNGSGNSDDIAKLMIIMIIIDKRVNML